MNKQLISIYLEELIFDSQNKDLIEAFGFKKVGQWAGQKAYDGDEADQRVKDIKSYDKLGFTNTADNLTKIHNKKSEQQKHASIAAQHALGAAYAGGAYLLYKGIKALYNKLKSANTPAEKIEIKSKIATKKAQLQKAKNSK